ncbi:MAG TPA: TauD/TfdA family dioxygenase [Burkholderiales bacterium]|nr:TauD/TfdA family dioxygenase [Burkholderiales bacterium]
MAIEFKPLHALFAAEAVGLDLSKPLAPRQVQDIVAGMDQYAVLVFRGQKLGEDEQIAYAKQFGTLDMGLRKLRKSEAHRFRHAELIDLSNTRADGKLVSRDDPKLFSNIANQYWHSDSSFQKPSARYSMLHAVVVPPKGGETEYADLRAAYDALPPDLKQEISGLEAEHYALHSRLMLGDNSYTEEQKKAIAPATWPLVRTHPGSKRKLLFVGIHTTHVHGMTVPEGRMLLAELLEHATQREFVYRHQWRVGDLVMWDNRAVVHRGRRWDPSQRREMRRATTEDVDASLVNAA